MEAILEMQNDSGGKYDSWEIIHYNPSLTEKEGYKYREVMCLWSKDNGS